MAQVIQELEITSENYHVAWQLLNENYENKASIIESHIKALFNQESLPKESHVELQQLLNNSLKHLRALKMLKQPTQYWVHCLFNFH